jgi:hypothetical protein
MTYFESFNKNFADMDLLIQFELPFNDNFTNINISPNLKPFDDNFTDINISPKFDNFESTSNNSINIILLWVITLMIGHQLIHLYINIV